MRKRKVIFECSLHSYDGEKENYIEKSEEKEFPEDTPNDVIQNAFDWWVKEISAAGWYFIDDEEFE